MKNALVILAPGFEEIEAITIIDLLRRADINVTTASISEKEVTGSHNIPVIADALINEITNTDFDIVLLPGGPGVSNLEKSQKVLDLILVQAAKNKLLGAICAAPIVLNRAGLLTNKSVTSHPSEEKTFTNSNYLYENVVMDGNIITSRAVGTALDFSLKIIETLIGKDKAKDIAGKILHAY